MKEAEVEANADADAQKNEVARMRAENVNALSVVLGKVLGTKAANGSEKKHVLVLDRIDRHRETTPIFLAGLGRLGKIVCSQPPPRRNYTDTCLSRYLP